jgi:hypothetical protein
VDIACSHNKIQNEIMFVTGGIRNISKLFFMFSLMKKSAFRVSGALGHRFCFGCMGLCAEKGVLMP